METDCEWRTDAKTGPSRMPCVDEYHRKIANGCKPLECQAPWNNACREKIVQAGGVVKPKMLICAKCGEPKPAEDFVFERTNKRAKSCKACRAQADMRRRRTKEKKRKAIEAA